MQVEPIKDSVLTDTTESYISDLENEIDELQSEVNRLKVELSQQSNNCCDAYNIIIKNFHNLLDDILPF